MCLALGEPEPGRLINVPRREQVLLRPQRERPVSALAREAHALGDEMPAESQSARLRVDDQQPQLRHRRRLANEEYRTDALTVALGDPAPLAARIELQDELGRDVRDQRFEALVPAVFAPVDLPVGRHDPSHVAGTVPTQRERLRRGGAGVEQPLDRLHGADQACLVGVGKRRDQCSHRLVRASVERRERAPTRGGQRQRPPARVVRRRAAAQQAARAEPLEDAAQVSAVEREVARQIARGHARAMRELVEHAHFGEREGAREEPFVQHADPARVEPVEAPHGRDAPGADFGHAHPSDDRLRSSAEWLTLSSG